MSALLALPGLLAGPVAAEIAASLAAAPFADGRGTAQGRARVAKHNEQLEATHPLARAAGARILDALARHEGFRAFALPHTVLPMTFARYQPGMGYADHIDLPVVGTASGPLRTDLSVTVFLSDGYDGGALIVSGPDGERRIKGGPGDAVVYASDAVHRVEPVTRGERLVAITWVQSLLRDAAERALVAELSEIEGALRASGAPEATLLRLAAVQARLVRRWVGA